MFVPRTVRDFGELVMLFNERHTPIRVDGERQLLDAGPVRLHWHDPFLHLRRTLHEGIAHAPAIDREVVACNHASQFPLLDFDAPTGVLAMHISTPILVDGVRVDLLDAFLRGLDVRFAELRTRFAPLVAPR